MKTILIDGDIIVYKVSIMNEFTTGWDEGIISFANPQAAKESCSNWINRLKWLLSADKVVLAMSDSGRYFRHEIWPSYKSNRKKTAKPLLLKTIRKFIFQEFDVVTMPTLEADDVLGILATDDSDPSEKIIVTSDKDLRQIPGLHYNPSDKLGNIEKVDKLHGEIFFWKQILIGDPTDCFPGCPGIGKKRAGSLIDLCVAKHVTEGGSLSLSIWKDIVKVFESKGFDENYVLSQARCARILQHQDYDHREGKPILWEPKDLPFLDEHL